MALSIFITGTDTGVGKTYFTTGIIRMLRKLGVDVVGFKPIECGGRSDSEALQAASGAAHSLDELNPVWFAPPLSPLMAADLSSMEIDLEKIHAAHQRLVAQHELVLVEGAGGWLVPVTAQHFMADLAAELCDEVIIVAANRLGVINHSLMTFRLIRQLNLTCSRLILNHLPETETDLSSSSNADMIRKCEPSLQVLPLHDQAYFEQLVMTFF
jgi:dethiobiotin synthetase